MEELLGTGAYATVYKGQSGINHSYVALKEIRLEHEEGAPCTAIREASLLKQLKQLSHSVLLARCSAATTCFKQPPSTTFLH